MRPAGCTRVPRPRHLLRGQKSPGEVGGTAAGSDAPTPAFTSSFHPFFSSRCLAKDERELRSRRHHRPGQGAQGAKARPLSGLRALHPLTSPAKAAEWGLSPGPGTWPAGTLPGSRPAPRAGDRRPRALWGLGCCPTGQAWGWSWLRGTPRVAKSSLSGLGCRGPRLNPLGRV